MGVFCFVELFCVWLVSSNFLISGFVDFFLAARPSACRNTPGAFDWDPTVKLDPSIPNPQGAILSIPNRIRVHVHQGSARERERKKQVLIRCPRKITEKYGLWSSLTRRRRSSTRKAPIKKNRHRRRRRGGCRGIGGDSSGGRGRRRRRRSICPARCGQGSKAGKEEPREFLRTRAHARNPARTGSHEAEGFGFFQLSPRNSHAQEWGQERDRDGGRVDAAALGLMRKAGAKGICNLRS